MSKRRCSQCDKELPASWSERHDANWDPVCPECASRDLKKKSLRRRRILDTSVRKKPNLELQPQAATPAQPQAPAQAPAAPQAQAPSQPPPQIPSSSNVSQRTPIPMDIELDTDDPLLLAAQQQATEEEDAEVDPMEETTQIRKPKLPPGPQVRLNF
jgi:DNA-directed RNA polymerase subunit RPC12/RpoP